MVIALPSHFRCSLVPTVIVDSGTPMEEESDQPPEIKRSHKAPGSKRSGVTIHSYIQSFSYWLTHALQEMFSLHSNNTQESLKIAFQVSTPFCVLVTHFFYVSVRHHHHRHHHGKKSQKSAAPPSSEPVSDEEKDLPGADIDDMSSESPRTRVVFQNVCFSKIP